MNLRKIMEENSVEKLYDVSKEDWMDELAKKCNTDCKEWRGSGGYNNYGCVQIVSGKGNIRW